MDQATVPFDLTRMVLGPQPFLFYVEILVRIVIVYIYTLVLLRWIGSRTIAQLSTVEFLLVIALGSAVGDSMFYPEVPLLQALLVVTVVILINKAIDLLLYRSDMMKIAVDGRAVEVVHNGRVAKEGLAARNMSVAELQEMLRLQGFSNLGEIATAYIETSGQMSVFPLKSPRVGLPLIPVREDPDENAIRTAASFAEGEDYACTHCGLTGAPPKMTDKGCCDQCGHSAWTKACIGPADEDLGEIRLKGGEDEEISRKARPSSGRPRGRSRAAERNSAPS
ncbi:DUF421 domain-containing protein [Aestuariivirga sp.]|uniref:DUF421 domain-containing protein n=1 Tax=Aestuariivirga sp. TaxID=2650926 RepID=UPI003BACE011